MPKGIPTVERIVASLIADDCKAAFRNLVFHCLGTQNGIAIDDVGENQAFFFIQLELHGLEDKLVLAVAIQISRLSKVVAAAVVEVRVTTQSLANRIIGIKVALFH